MSDDSVRASVEETGGARDLVSTQQLQHEVSVEKPCNQPEADFRFAFGFMHSYEIPKSVIVHRSPFTVGISRDPVIRTSQVVAVTKTNSVAEGARRFTPYLFYPSFFRSNSTMVPRIEGTNVSVNHVHRASRKFLRHHINAGLIYYQNGKEK